MRAIVVRQIGSYALEQVAKPVPTAGEVLLEVAVAGLCRTDLKLIEHGHRDLVLPRIPAEEVVGRVVQCGPDVDPALLGQRMYVYPGMSCRTCARCRSGAENLCTSMRIMGFHRDGGFAEFVRVPVPSLIAIPDNLDWATAVFAEPLSCCLNALELARLQPGETICVWGAGPAGTLLARAATAFGACVTSIEPDLHRRERAAGGMAAPPAAHCCDVAIVAVGSAAAYAQALRSLAPRGRLVVFSGLLPDAAIQPVDLNQLHYLEQTVSGAYGCCRRHGEQALAMLSAGAVEVADLVSGCLSLEELPKALAMVKHRQAMKLLLDPRQAAARTDFSQTELEMPPAAGGTL